MPRISLKLEERHLHQAVTEPLFPGSLVGRANPMDFCISERIQDEYRGLIVDGMLWITETAKRIRGSCPHTYVRLLPVSDDVLLYWVMLDRSQPPYFKTPTKREVETFVKTFKAFKFELFIPEKYLNEGGMIQTLN